MTKHITIIQILVSFFVAALMFSCDSEDKFASYGNDAFIRRQLSPGIEEPDPSRTYPDVFEIVNSPAVVSQMDAAWSNTLNSCNQSTRQEYGFYIYCSPDGTIYCGDIISGPPTQNDPPGRSSITFGRCANNQDVCATFHTHPPMVHVPANYSRGTGPSDEDGSFATDYTLPGIVRDYVGPVVVGGSPVNAPTYIYTYGPSRREIVSL